MAIKSGLLDDVKQKNENEPSEENEIGFECNFPFYEQISEKETLHLTLK